jgi:hypothetical protein
VQLVFDDNFSSVRVIPLLGGIVSGTRKIAAKTVLDTFFVNSRSVGTLQKTLTLTFLIITSIGFVFLIKYSDYNSFLLKVILKAIACNLAPVEVISS